MKGIYTEWFESDDVGIDPKYNMVKQKIAKSLEENKNRKLVVFSTFADTAEYVKEHLERDGFRVLLYTGGASQVDRSVVKCNFDASCKPADQANDYDIIVATDALSEGFEPRGVIINYDIPYNPTRVVQRIGRINRINKKMLIISTSTTFPTDIGEKTRLLRAFHLKYY